MQSVEPSVINNFDLIRICAALQVVFRHLFFDRDFHNEFLNFLKNIILSFPGVPVFFTVSGFLIYWSFERNSNHLKKYFINRFLRIYPALWACLAITIIILFVGDKNGVIFKNLTLFLIWIVGQLTFIQFWTPEFLKFWGEGSPNASLWTICVELQFYFLIPILFYLINRFKKYKLWILFFLFLSSMIFNAWTSTFGREDLIYKLGFVSIFQYLFYFMFGVFAYNYWNKIRGFLEGKFFIWIIIFLPLYLFFRNKIDIELNDYHLKSFYKILFIMLLNATVISFAFTYKNLSKKILNGQDLSYGIYIYHMVIINIFIEYNIPFSMPNIIVIFLMILSSAALSWFLVEKNALKLKNKKTG